MLLRIGEARLAIKIKENLTSMDYKIDKVLEDCANILIKQILSDINKFE